MLSPVGGYILQEFDTLYLTIFRTYKIARPPQKPTRGGGSQTDKYLAQSPNFSNDDILLWRLYSQLVHFVRQAFLTIAHCSVLQ